MYNSNRHLSANHKLVSPLAVMSDSTQPIVGERQGHLSSMNPFTWKDKDPSEREKRRGSKEGGER